MDFSCKCASILLLLTAIWGFQYSCCQGLGTFGFDIHHRYSDTVKGILGLDGLPEKGSMDYYAAMVHHDRLRHGRHLAATTTAAVGSPPLDFSSGNETFQMEFWHYAEVNVGSPGLWFLVALDTGSSLSWLPCDCSSCYASGHVRYSPNTSSTSVAVSCNSTFCVGLPEHQCSSAPYPCLYQYEYVSNDTYSSGFMVEDVLHLITDDSQLKPVDAQVPLGCGRNQGGIFLDGLAPNGLFGLGMRDISVPSVLASQGLTANSFSMCFGPNGTGRINFGDTGSSGQAQTPFNLDQSYPAYNVTVSKVTVGNNVTGVSFTAIFDSGTSITHLNDPAYTIITESFNSQVQQTQHFNVTPFEYCYNLSFQPPTVNLTMNGGDQFYVTDPIESFSLSGGSVYCLAIIKTSDKNFIGQNFMTGYNIVFDRENMVLGWEASNCYGAEPQSSANSPSSSSSPHNIQEAFAGFLFIFLLYSALI